MTRAAVLREIERTRLVPVLRAPSEALAIEAAAALVAGEIRVVEVTMTVPNAMAVIRALVSRAEQEPEAERPIIGAGTVLTADDAMACIDAGARFVVSPNLNLELVDRVRRQEVAVMPGALTPTEVVSAWQAGADMVKVFPCSAMGGARYLRALRAPLPSIKLLPTGGVRLDNARDYLEAGAAALGIGADLVDMKLLEAGQASGLTERARAFVKAVSAAVGSLDKTPRSPPSSH